jgi:hypothetical protein
MGTQNIGKWTNRQLSSGTPPELKIEDPASQIIIETFEQYPEGSRLKCNKAVFMVQEVRQNDRGSMTCHLLSPLWGGEERYDRVLKSCRIVEGAYVLRLEFTDIPVLTKEIEIQDVTRGCHIMWVDTNETNQPPQENIWYEEELVPTLEEIQQSDRTFR